MNIILEHDLQYIIRILVACVCGVLIGLERKSRAKEAGIRTHCLVACAAAIMMILSKYAYSDMTGEIIKLDPSRVASGVASGVGFLGAGMIFVHKRTITGLTTAAGIWATAGVGMAFGSGMYVIGAAATIIILLVQLLLHTNAKWLQRPRIKELLLYSDIEYKMQQYAYTVFDEMNIKVEDLSIKKDINANRVQYRFQIEIPSSVTESEILSRFECDSSLISRE